MHSKDRQSWRPGSSRPLGLQPQDLLFPINSDKRALSNLPGRLSPLLRCRGSPHGSGRACLPSFPGPAQPKTLCPVPVCASSMAFQHLDMPMCPCFLSVLAPNKGSSLRMGTPVLFTSEPPVAQQGLAHERAQRFAVWSKHERNDVCCDNGFTNTHCGSCTMSLCLMDNAYHRRLQEA